MKLVIIKVILCYLFGSVCTKNYLKTFELDSNATIISQVLLDIVDEFLVKENIMFNILIIKQYKTQFSWDILNNFMSRNSMKFNYQLRLNNKI